MKAQLAAHLSRLWHRALSVMLADMNSQELGWLVRPGGHLNLVANRRTTIIISRARLVAGLFGILTPLWIVADVAAFPREVWLPLVVARLAATVAFFGVLILPRRMGYPSDIYPALGLLLAIPTVFFLFTYQHMAGFELHGVQAAFATGYAFLPFVMLAGLAIFPLTLTESLFFATPMLLTQGVAAVLDLPLLNWPTVAASFWLLVLIAGVSALAGLSQLAFIIVLVRDTIRDSLTGCYSRHSGEELLELQFINCLRSGAPLAVAFIDLDHFKQVNDSFGHDAGDQVLRDTVAIIRMHLRTGDFLVRWGGEEFLLAMPNTAAAHACVALDRLRSVGLGSRPDDRPVTASIGVAERLGDGLDTWEKLVALADERMYEVKQAGRNGVRGCGPAAA